MATWDIALGFLYTYEVSLCLPSTLRSLVFPHVLFARIPGLPSLMP